MSVIQQRASSNLSPATMNRKQNSRHSSLDTHSRSSPRKTTKPQTYSSCILPATLDSTGREVERFAEKLDRWSISREQGASKRYRATFGLVSDLRSVIESSLGRLKKQARTELRRARGSHSPFSSPGIRKPEDQADDDNDEILGNGDLGRDTKRLQAELDTWILFENLLRHRFQQLGTTIEAKEKLCGKEDGDIGDQTPESTIWGKFLFQDKDARERDVVCKWLETIATHTSPSSSASISHADKESESGIWSHGWLHTREKIKAQKRLSAVLSRPTNGAKRGIEVFDGDKPIASMLDPDAMSRQGYNLDMRDASIERNFWKSLWTMIKGGTKMEDMLEWCRDRNEGWRALSLGPDITLDPASTGVSKESAALWRCMCRAAATSATSDDYERAVYGLLGGMISAVEPVCTSWNDVLYAHFRTMNVRQFDVYLQKHYPDRFSAALVRKFSNLTNLSEVEPHANPSVIERLRSHPHTKAQAETPLQLIQACLISDNFLDLVDGVGRVIQLAGVSDVVRERSKLSPAVLEHVNRFRPVANDATALRMVVHMQLVLEVFRPPVDHVDSTLVKEYLPIGYIKLLNEGRKFDLIPLYASLLSTLMCSTTLGKILPDIKGPRERLQLARLMEQYNIDIIGTLVAQYDTTLLRSPLRPYVGFDPSKISVLESTTDKHWPGYRLKENFLGTGPTAEEDVIIRSIEWYLLLQGQWRATFRALAHTHELFLHHGRIASAVLLSRKMSCRKVSNIKTPHVFGREFDVTEDQDGSDEGIDISGSQVPRSTTIRRSSMIKKKSDSTSDEQSPKDNPARLSFCKQTSRYAHELEQLAHAMHALSQWQTAERKFFESESSYQDDRGGVASQARKASIETMRRAYDDVREAFEPLISKVSVAERDELNYGTDDKSYRAKVKAAYLAELILAYLSVIYSAAQTLPPTPEPPLLDAMELVGRIGDEEHAGIISAFRATGRMHQLVTALALCSKAMVKYEEELKGKFASVTKAMKKSRKRNAKSISIWNISGSG